MNHKSIGLTAILAGLLLFVQNMGWIDLTDILNTPDDNPTVIVEPDDKPIVDPKPVPVDPVPIDPTPQPQPKPEPVVPVPNPILVEIDEEVFPPLPENLSSVSLPIKQILVTCDSPDKALILARFYAHWSTYIVQESSGVITSTEKYRNVYQKLLTAIKQQHQLSTFCPGITDAIDAVIIQQIGLDQRELSSTDREKLGVAFQAVSARSYEAFKELMQ